MRTTIIKHIMHSNLMKISGWSVAFVIMLQINLFGQEVLSLDEALEIAIRNSPEIITAELNMKISEEQLKARQAATKSSFLFQVTPVFYNQRRAFNEYFALWNTSETFSTYGQFVVRQPIVLTDGTISLINRLEYQDANTEFSERTIKGYNNNLYLELNQPLFTFNRLKMELERLRLDLENTTYSYAIQRMFLERKVTEHFYNVYQRQMALQIALEEYENQKSSTEIIRSKVEADLSPREELYQAELNMESSNSKVQNSLVDLENAKDVFKEEIGMPLKDDFTTDADIQYNLVPVDFNVAVEHGLKTRLELRQKEILLENSYNDYVVAKSTNEFRGDMALSIGLFGENNRLTNVYETPTRSPQVAVSFNIPIWDWGERKSRIKIAESNIKIREIDIQNNKNEIEMAIRQSYRRLENLVLQIEIAKHTLRNADLTYEINLDRYKNGDLTSMDLGLFQTQLSEKKMNLSNSLINYKLELLNMKIQSLWDFQNNTSFVPQYLQNNLNQ